MRYTRRAFLVTGLGLTLAGCAGPTADDSPPVANEVVLDVPGMH
jgi:hypothetical protein